MNRGIGKGEKRDQGFTLIEVVIALAVLGVGLVVIIELFSGGLRLGRTSVEYTRAVEYARLKLEEVTLADQLVEGEETGEFDKDFQWWVGITKIDLLPPAKVPDFKPPVEVYQVKVAVTWKSGLRERSTELETLKTIKAQEDEQKS